MPWPSPWLAVTCPPAISHRCRQRRSPARPDDLHRPTRTAPWACAVSESRVNRRLTPRAVENDDFAGFSRRIVAAHGRRVARGDIEGLGALAALADDVDVALFEAIRGLRRAGFSWADIGTRLGMTRQAAQQRWSHTNVS